MSTVEIWAGVAVWLAIAVATGVVGAAKERGGGFWFVMGLLGTVLAFIVVAALPALRAGSAGAYAGGAPVEPARRPCPHCAEMILPDARKCRFCGESVEPAVAPARKVRYVRCPNCGRMTAAAATCDLCGEPMQARG